jgi:hypothetical protein
MPGDISPRHADKAAAAADDSWGGLRTGGAGCSWVRNEWELDRAGTVTGPVGDAAIVPPDTAPEHYLLYAAAQKEWWPYDVYARICMLYGFLSFIHALGFYSLGHLNIEVRSFWVPYATSGVIMTLHFLLLKFDIVQGRIKKPMIPIPYAQYLGPLSVAPAALAMSLDFLVEFNPVFVVICYLLQFTSYGMVIVYMLRMLEVILPDESHLGVDKEIVGSNWWPDSWKLPSSFQHVLYLVAPPRKLAPGQFDLVREIRNGTGSHIESASKDTKKAWTNEEISAQEAYVEDLFTWAKPGTSTFNSLSKNGKETVKALIEQWKEGSKTGKSKDQEASKKQHIRKIKETIAGLDAVMTQEGITPEGLASCGFSDAGSSPPPTPRTTGADIASGSAAAAAEPTKGSNGFAADYSRERVQPQLLHTQMQHVEPWRLVAYIVISMIAGYTILMLMTFVEIFVGEQGFVTAPHWSRPPMTRASKSPHETGTPYGFPWPAASQPYLPEQLVWHEEKRGKDVRLIARAAGYPGIPADGIRRLSGNSATDKASTVASLQELFGALPPEVADARLSEIVAGGNSFTEAKAAKSSMLASSGNWPKAVPEKISWPSFFEPKLLACGGNEHWVAAISTRGFGATATLGTETDVNNAASFRLSGVSHLAPLAGASWSSAEHGADKEGLLLVTTAGDILMCAGQRPRAGGSWHCGPMSKAPVALPIVPGSSVHAAAMGWLRGSADLGGPPRLHAALVSEHTPDQVVLYTLEDSGAWLPLGEVPLPSSATTKQRISLAFTTTGELQVGTADGGLIQRRLADGRMLRAGAHGMHSTHATEWQAACALQGSVAHLVLRGSSLGPSSPLAAWRPEVHTASWSVPSDIVLE